MKKVYFSQPNCRFVNSIYFPYAAGVIASYAWQFDEVKDNYALGGFIYRLDSIEESMSFIKDPYLVAFSNYIWNYKYNLDLAQKIKQVYPECIIVFGGHQIPDNTEWLEMYPFIDILIFGEGEIPFTDMLKNLAAGGNLNSVFNLAYRENGTVYKSPRNSNVVADYPSPYIGGIFDSLLEQKPDELSLCMLIETNRGCPYHCSFCDWGEMRSKVRKFSIDKILAEIDWMAEHKIDYCFCTDANFGIFERDEIIIDKLIDSKEKTGYPEKFQTSFSKRSNQRIHRMNLKLQTAGMSKGVTLSLQSLSPAVLKNIGRENMTPKSFADLIGSYNKENITAYSEIILGLPGETYESFRDGLCELLELGQHSSICVFSCELLTNSEMGSDEYIKRFSIKTVETPLNINHCHPSSIIQSGYSRLVVETDSMTTSDWKRMHIFADCIRAFHNLGLVQCFAIYLHYEKNVPYNSFYESLIDWSYKHKDTAANKAFSVLNDVLEKVLAGKSALVHSDPEHFGMLLWPLEEAVFLQISLEYERFYSEIVDFLSGYFVNDPVFDELLIFQKNILKLPRTKNLRCTFKYDFYNYFENIYANRYQKLNLINNEILFDNSSIPEKLEEYAKIVVWYGRRCGKIFNEDVICSFWDEGEKNISC